MEQFKNLLRTFEASIRDLESQDDYNDYERKQKLRIKYEEAKENLVNHVSSLTSKSK